MGAAQLCSEQAARRPQYDVGNPQAATQITEAGRLAIVCHNQRRGPCCHLKAGGCDGSWSLCGVGHLRGAAPANDGAWLDVGHELLPLKTAGCAVRVFYTVGTYVNAGLKHRCPLAHRAEGCKAGVGAVRMAQTPGLLYHFTA